MPAVHLMAAMLIAAGLALFFLPTATLQLILTAHTTIPAIMDQSTPALLLHVGLSACVWALCVILYKMWNRPRARMIHSLGQRGSVMTETIIVMPLFFLLTFGMAQLAVNNIGGILANVAVYASARAAWVWQPEVGVERVDKTVSAEEAVNRARIAAALVMTPATPGDFLSGTVSDEAFKDTRLAMVAAQVPIAGALGMESLLAAAGVPSVTLATQGNLSVSRALDDSGFVRRTMLKFTHAYQATTIEITEDDGRIGVDMTFKLHQVMPVVGRIFGDFDTVSGRAGYFNEFTRSYTFKTQPYTPNAALPDGTFSGTEASDDEGGFGDVDWDSKPDPE